MGLKWCITGSVELSTERQGTMYQKLFNDTLSKLRLVLVATGNQDLMKAVAKVMFDFSDDLKNNNILKDEENKNDTKRSVQTL